MDWYDAKVVVMEMTGVSRDGLHVFGGVFAQLLVAAVLRRSLASPLPWLCVLGAEMANEWFDLNHETWPDRSMWPGVIHDVWVTMLVPTVLLLLVRYAPWLFQAAKPCASAQAEPEVEEQPQGVEREE